MRSVFSSMIARISVVFIVSTHGAWGGSDPCFLNQALDGVQRNTSLVQESEYKCDDTLKKDWYRFTSREEIPMKLATQWTTVHRCGTYSTVWLNGKHPSVDQGIISCQVCANVANIAVECPWPWTIRVKNCHEFFVYELIPTPYCPMRYCTSL